MKRAIMAIPTVPPIDEWPTLVTVGAVAVAVEVGLRTMPLPRLSVLLGAPLDTNSPIPNQDEVRPIMPPWVRRQVKATARILRHWPWGDTCLRSALIIGHRVRALDPVLRVGVARVEGEVRAHAWLEISGVRLDPFGSADSYALLQPAVPRQGT